MKFSGEITLGTIVSVIAFLATMIPLFMRMGRIIQLFETFPPHRHQGRFIIYPRGFEPKAPEELDRNGE